MSVTAMEIEFALFRLPKDVSIIWASNFIPGCLPWRNQRCSQQLHLEGLLPKITQTSIDRGMGK